MQDPIEELEIALAALRQLEPSHLWLIGLGVDANGRVFGPTLRGGLDLGECDCPGDCRHDHENE